MVTQKTKRQRVAVAIITHKDQPDRMEQLSFLQCISVLKDHPIFLICPDNLGMNYYRDLDFDQFDIRPVSHKHLNSKLSYNRFKKSKEFYQQFDEFDFVLTYELDSYVFTDRLLEWCDSGFDYVGAPWFEGFESPKKPLKFRGVGNSGFSLRNVSACLKVLRNYSPVDDGNEDVFWGLVVPQKCSFFKVAPPEIALKFSFEVKPKYLYTVNNKQLPFGCHAWNRYEPKFWRQFIELSGTG